MKVILLVNYFLKAIFMQKMEAICWLKTNNFLLLFFSWTDMLSASSTMFIVLNLMNLFHVKSFIKAWYLSYPQSILFFFLVTYNPYKKLYLTVFHKLILLIFIFVLFPYHIFDLSTEKTCYPMQIHLHPKIIKPLGKLIPNIKDFLISHAHYLALLVMLFYWLSGL